MAEKEKPVLGSLCSFSQFIVINALSVNVFKLVTVYLATQDS